jgi:hypothetical protein
MRAADVPAVAALAAMAIAAPVRAADAPESDAEVCAPACHPGEVCFQGVCMVPAPRGHQPAPQGPAAPPYPYPPPPYGYSPPPYGYPPPPYSYPAPRPRPPRTGFLAIPYVGLNSFSGDGASGIDTGLRIGAILGGRVNDLFSVNGEVIADVLNFNTPPGVSASETITALAGSPLFHLTTPSVDLVVGPKFGFWYLSGHASNGLDRADVTGHGWTLGLNLGVFFPVSDSASLGMLFSFATLEPMELCGTRTSYYGYTEDVCLSDGLDSTQVLGLTFAALF